MRSCRCLSDDQLTKCAQRESHVEPERPATRVGDIHVESLDEGGMCASGHLPETGNAGRYEEAVEVVNLELVDLVRKARSWADERHVSAQDVDQLRQLVEARSSQPSPGSRDRVGAVELEQANRRQICVPLRRGLDVGSMRVVRGTVSHRPELQHRERALIDPEAGLPKEDRSGRITPYHERDDREEGSKEHERAERNDDVQRALDQARRAREPYGRETEQRQSFDRVYTDAGPDELEC